MKLIYRPRTVTLKGSLSEINDLLSDARLGADRKNMGIADLGEQKQNTARRARLYLQMEEQLEREGIEYIQDRGL